MYCVYCVVVAGVSHSFGSLTEDSMSSEPATADAGAAEGSSDDPNRILASLLDDPQCPISVDGLLVSFAQALYAR